MAKNSRRASNSSDAPVNRRADRAAAETRRARRIQESEAGYAKPSPAWLVPTACTLLIVGILYMVVYYISGAHYPLPIGDWNLAVGIGIILTGGALLTTWR